LLPHFRGVAASFFVTAVLWIGHHQLFRSLVRGDLGLVWLKFSAAPWHRDTRGTPTDLAFVESFGSCMRIFRSLADAAFACSLVFASAATVLSYLSAEYVRHPACAEKALLKDTA